MLFKKIWRCLYQILSPDINLKILREPVLTGGKRKALLQSKVITPGKDIFPAQELSIGASYVCGVNLLRGYALLNLKK